jgi:hypothetical protein
MRQLFASTVVPLPVAPVHAGLVQVAVPFTVVGTHLASGPPHWLFAVHTQALSAALGVPDAHV